MNRTLVLMYHAVDEPRGTAEARFCVRPAAFREQMKWLLCAGYQPVPANSLVTALRQDTPLPPRAIVVTFDDGFECFYRNALPILVELDIPATIFAVAGKLGGTNDWMQAKGWPARRLMDAAQLRGLQDQGITIGCHGLTHVAMPAIDDAQLRAETTTAREVLSRASGSEVTLFAYPHGAQGVRERQAVQTAGFVAAFSTMSGFNNAGADPFALRRIDVYGSDTLATFHRKVGFGVNRIRYVDLLHYYVQRVRVRLHG